MPRSPYALPTSYLVEQGFHTRGDLAQVAQGSLRDDWERAGVDVTVLAGDVHAVAEGLFEAQVESGMAELAVRSAARRGGRATAEAHAWLAWLDGVVDDAVAEGGPSPVLVPPRSPTRAKPSLVGVTSRVRALLPDVARERDRLARFTGRPALLDRGATLLAELEAAALQVRVAADRRARAAAAEVQARARFVQVFRRLDRMVARVAKVTGRTPALAASRQVLRAEARRRDAVARRRKEPAVAAAAAGDVGVDA